MNENDIKLKFPSLCWDCTYARNPASENNLQKGFCGCSYGLDMGDHNLTFEEFIIDASIIGEGWVDLRSVPFGESSGVITNYQYLVNGVKKCKGFTKKL